MADALTTSRSEEVGRLMQRTSGTLGCPARRCKPSARLPFLLSVALVELKISRTGKNRLKKIKSKMAIAIPSSRDNHLQHCITTSSIAIIYSSSTETDAYLRMEIPTSHTPRLTPYGPSRWVRPPPNPTSITRQTLTKCGDMQCNRTLCAFPAVTPAPFMLYHPKIGTCGHACDAGWGVFSPDPRCWVFGRWHYHATCAGVRIAGYNCSWSRTMGKDVVYLQRILLDTLTTSQITALFHLLYPITIIH